MNLNKVIVIIFATSILIISSSQISFAKKNDEEEDEEDLKIPVSSIDKTKKIKDSKETEVQNDILNDHYPNQYYVCGYPQQLVTDYNSFAKFNCN